MFLFFLRSDLFTLCVCPSEILTVLHILEPAFNSSLFSLWESSSDLADGISEMCNLFCQPYKALGSIWFPSFLYYNMISVPTDVVYRQFAGDSSTCEQWHSHSDPVIAASWTVLLYLKVLWGQWAGPCSHRMKLLAALCLHQACAHVFLPPPSYLPLEM